MKLIRISILAALTALTLLPGAADAAATKRISIMNGAQGDDSSYNAAISDEGPFGLAVAFESLAANFHPGDFDSFSDVFLYASQGNSSVLISRATGLLGAKGNGSSSAPSISADGLVVAFQSSSSNLHPSDTDTIVDIFIRDSIAFTTTLVSAGLAGKGNGDSLAPALSADARFVAFSSSSSNLHPDDPDALPDVYTRPLDTVVFDSLVSRATGTLGLKGNGSSTAPTISGDGRLVAFQSSSSNLHPDDPDITSDIFVRDLQTDTTTLVSRTTGTLGIKGNGSSTAPTISGDGRLVAFQSSSSNLHPDDPDTQSDVFVRDLQAGTTALVSRASGGSGTKGNGSSSEPAVSPDARFVAFQSSSSNLHPNDPDTTNDIFVRDLQTSTTLLVSRSSTGTKGNVGSFRPAINAGALVAFESDANNLVVNDTNIARDVFMTTDFDFDRMPNDYELANTCLDLVTPDGAADPDGDGRSSIAEFGTGTDPCDADTDADGTIDSLDPCPLLAEDFDGFQDSDGCPDPDNDLDGICDSGQTSVSCTGSDIGKYCFDAAGNLACHLAASSDCRNVAEDLDAFKDTDGCPEPDNDNDGFPDATDACPGTGSQAGADGMLGSPQDLNHNGIRDGAEAILTTDDVPTYAFEDRDGILDTDGCHDSPGEDFDGDGFTDDAEALKIGTNPGYPCGNPGWPADLLPDNRLNVGDINSFLFPLRGNGSFNKFDHPVPDPQDPSIGRWNLQVDGTINIGDLNALNPAVLAPTARPPMFGGQPAFFANAGNGVGGCPLPP